MDFDTDDMVPHIIYCYGDIYHYYEDDLKTIVKNERIRTSVNDINTDVHGEKISYY